MSTHASSSCPFRSYSLARAPKGGLAARSGIVAFSLLAYASFFGAITYAIGFVGNWVVPKSIDTGSPAEPLEALAINAALLGVFVVQHTVMARRPFKRWITRFIPGSMERSVFVLAASASLALLFWQWRPLPAPVWEVTSPAAAWALRGVSLAGWAVVFGSSFLINHFDLFGLRQAWRAATGRDAAPVEFRLVGLYRLVRHPLMLGFLIAFWATPVMTVGHLFFSVMTSLYIAMGVWFEERDLVAEHGETYLDYRRTVRALIPWPKRSA